MNSKNSIVKFINIPKIEDDCFLCFAQYPNIPFKINRIYYIVRANPDFSRGLHSHYTTDQVVFCIQGSVEIILDNGVRKENVVLNEPQKGILIPKMVWHEIINFQKSTILLVIASKKFDPGDYIRDYDLFIKSVNEKNR